MKLSWWCAVQSSQTDDAALTSIPISQPDSALAMLATPAIGALLILVGILLFVVDLHVIGHGLLTAGGIVTLLAGGLLLMWAGVPYSGVLLGALAVVAVLMGGVLLGV